MAYGTFGDIRALLHGAPSKGTWEKLCAEVRLWREPELSQVVFPYVLAQLERWPDDLRVVRPDWAKDLLRGRSKGAHFTALARTLRIERLTPTANQWDNLNVLDWRSLRHVSVRGNVPGLHAWLPKAHAQGVFDDLQTLYLYDSELAEHIGPMCYQGVFTPLERLDLVGSTLAPEDFLELATAEWPRLHTLTIRHHERDQGRTRSVWTLKSMEPLTEELDAPRLRAVDFGGLEHEIEVLIQILSATWLPRLTHLSLRLNGLRGYEYMYSDTARVEAAIKSADFSALEHLDVHEGAQPVFIDALAGNPTLENLKSLSAEGLSRYSRYRYEQLTEHIKSSNLPDAVKAQW